MTPRQSRKYSFVDFMDIRWQVVFRSLLYCNAAESIAVPVVTTTLPQAFLPFFLSGVSFTKHGNRKWCLRPAKPSLLSFEAFGRAARPSFQRELRGMYRIVALSMPDVTTNFPIADVPIVCPNVEAFTKITAGGVVQPCLDC